MVDCTNIRNRPIRNTAITTQFGKLFHLRR